MKDLERRKNEKKLARSGIVERLKDAASEGSPPSHHEEKIAGLEREQRLKLGESLRNKIKYIKRKQSTDIGSAKLDDESQ